MILQQLYNNLGGTGFYGQQAMICDCNTMHARIEKFPKTLSSSKRLEQVNLRMSREKHQNQLIHTCMKTRALSITTSALI